MQIYNITKTLLFHEWMVNKDTEKQTKIWIRDTEKFSKKIWNLAASRFQLHSIVLFCFFQMVDYGLPLN